MNERQKYWDEHYKEKYQGSSEPGPFIAIPNYIDMFYLKRVLEIGPGDGRQYRVIKPLTAGYSIADISQKVLDLDIYNGLKRYLIKDYKIDTDDKFDTIHAWYVLHHVLYKERKKFFSMIKRHLRSKGNFLFNFSTISNDIPTFSNTTKCSFEEIEEYCQKFKFEIRSDSYNTMYQHDNNNVVWLQNIDL